MCICTTDVRNLDFWVYFKEHQANIVSVQAEASKLVHNKLEGADMLHHIWFFFKFLGGHVFKIFVELLRQDIQTKQAGATETARSIEPKACDKCEEDTTVVGTSALLEMYANFSR